MNKRKIAGVAVFFEDGTTEQYQIPGTFSESHNSRKAGGFKNEQEWTEYHITFVKYSEPITIEEVKEEIIKQDREMLRGMAWCAVHGMEPHNCFHLHNPTAYSGREQTWGDEIVLSGKPSLMRAYGLTDEGLKKWMEQEDKKVESVFPKFDFDLKEGYGNGKVT